MAPARDFTIVYGSQTIGGNGESIAFPIVGKLTTAESPEEFSCSFSFLVSGTSPANFEDNLSTVRTAFRKPNQSLTITVGDTQTRDTWYSFDHQTGTGFNATPEITKEAAEEDSGLLQRLTVSIEIQLPADKLGIEDGQLGRRTTNVSVETAASGRRTLIIDGVYTATTTNETAVAQYAASIDAYALAVHQAYDSGATWELVEDRTNIEDTAIAGTSPDADIGKGKVCTFRRAYEELLIPQAGTPNDAEIIRQRFRCQTLKFNRDTVGGLAVSTDSDRLMIAYNCEIDTAKTGTDLVQTYEEKVRGFIYDEARDMTGIESGLIIYKETVDYNFDTNEIAATMEVGGVAGDLNTASVEIEDAYSDTGQTLVPVWSGDPLDHYVYLGPQTRTRKIVINEFIPNINESARVLPRGAFQNPENGITKSHSVRHVPLQSAINFDGSTTPRFFQGNRITTIEIQYFSNPGESGEVGQMLGDLTGVTG